MVADVLELRKIHLQAMRQFRRRDLYFDLMQGLHHDVARLFCGRRTYEFERDIERDFLALFDDIEIRMQQLSGNRMELYVVDGCPLIPPGTRERYFCCSPPPLPLVFEPAKN